MAQVETGTIAFDVYEGSRNFYGTAEAKLPEVSEKTEEITGAGIMGSFNAVYPGQVESMAMTLTFRNLSERAYFLAEQRNHRLELRAAQQEYDSVAGEYDVSGIKHVLHWYPNKIDPGKLAPASTAEVSVEGQVTYFATFIDGVKKQEIDILNGVFSINGTDAMAAVRKALGRS